MKNSPFYRVHINRMELLIRTSNCAEKRYDKNLNFPGLVFTDNSLKPSSSRYNIHSFIVYHSVFISLQLPLRERYS